MIIMNILACIEIGLALDRQQETQNPCLLEKILFENLPPLQVQEDVTEMKWIKNC